MRKVAKANPGGHAVHAFGISDLVKGKIKDVRKSSSDCRSKGIMVRMGVSSR